MAELRRTLAKKRKETVVDPSFSSSLLKDTNQSSTISFPFIGSRAATSGFTFVFQMSLLVLPFYIWLG